MTTNAKRARRERDRRRAARWATWPALVIVLALAAIAVACGEESGGQPRATGAVRADRFDDERAWAWLRRQVSLGPRPAGSDALRRLAAQLVRALPRGRLEPIAGHPGLRNIVGRIPGRRPAVLVAAHYDTKDIRGFVGANDGASGTAVLVEVARVLAAARRPRGAPEIRFVLFDGEEATDDDRFYETALRGSKPYARRHAGDLRAMILLDFVGEKELRIPREASSDEALWDRLRAAARRVGALEAFPDETQGSILDDHTPFLREGVPAVDLIDFDFDCWHRTCDDLDVVSRRSLDLVGETVVELLRTWR